MAYQEWSEVRKTNLRDLLRRYLQGDVVAQEPLTELMWDDRSFHNFSIQFKRICTEFPPQSVEWQERLVAFVGDLKQLAGPRYAQLGALLPRLLPRYQLELLAHSLNPGEHVDSDALAKTFFRCCLYGVKYLSSSCLLRNRAQLIVACRALGPAWQTSAGLCFAAELPWSLLEDESFVRLGLSFVNDDGHSLQWLTCAVYREEPGRSVVMAFVKNNPSLLRHTKFCDDADAALEALQHDVNVVDFLSVRLRRQRKILEAAASRGVRFFFTETGEALRADRALVLLAAEGNAAEYVDMSRNAIAKSLHSDPGVLAAVVHGLMGKEEHEASVRRILEMQETQQDAFYRELLKKPGSFQLLDSSVRARRDIVLLATAADVDALAFVDPAVWIQDAGLDDFLFSVLSAGCSRNLVPAELWQRLEREGGAVALAAALLLENRAVWTDLPQSTQLALKDCFEHRCSICFQLPKEIRMCSPINGNNCRYYFCRPCLEEFSSRCREGVRCPTCRLPQVPGQSCGIRAWPAETLVERELIEAAAKRRRI